MVALDFTPAQEEAFKQSYRARWWVPRLAALPFFAALLVVLLELGGTSDLAARLGFPTWLLPTMAFLLALFALTASFWAWRCPACRRFLGAEASPSYCRRCGVPFT